MNSTPINNINLPALDEAKAAIQAQPDLGIVNYGVELTWQSGTRAIAKALPILMGQELIDRNFTWTIDEPQPLLGENSGPTPQEYLMSGVGACILVGFAVNAAIMGVKINQLAVTVTGSLNLSGFLNLDPQAPIEMLGIQYKIAVAADGTEEQLKEIESKAIHFSPNAMTVAKGIAFSGEMEILKRSSQEPMLI
jgi:uncharacterized OsmC-like protein